jgi:sodium/potassium/calcium exchanger 6
MGESLAGVTLVPLGNGAPDVIGSLAASNSNSSEGINLSIGGLVGSTLILTHLISPLLTLISPEGKQKMPSRTYMRDLVFLVVTIDVLSLFYFLEMFTWWMGVVFLLIYLVYVLISLYMDKGKPSVDVSLELEVKRKKLLAQKKKLREEIKSMNSRDSVFESSASILLSPSPKKTNRQVTLTGSVIARKMKTSKHLIQAIINDDEYFGRSSILYKAFYYCLKVPITMIIQITLPPIDKTDWDRRIAIISPIGSSTFVWVVLELYKYGWKWVLYIYIAAAILSITIFLLTRARPKEFPAWGAIFSFYNFAVSILWLWFLANIIVDIIHIIGNVTGMSIPFLGVALLAFGNSVGDMMTDISLAKLGLAQMGMTATVSGSVFNVMLGFGLSLLIKGAKGELMQPTPFRGSGMISGVLIIAAVGMISLMVSVIVANGYTYTKTYAIIQILEYVGLILTLIIMQII